MKPPLCFYLPFDGREFCFAAKWQPTNNLMHVPVAFAFTVVYLILLLLTPFDFLVAVSLSTALGVGTGIGKEVAEGTCGQGFDFIDLACWLMGVAVAVMAALFTYSFLLLLGFIL